MHYAGCKRALRSDFRWAETKASDSCYLNGLSLGDRIEADSGCQQMMKG